jgi:hypothetical protein
MENTDLRTIDLEGDVNRYRAVVDVLVRHNEFLTELIKRTIDLLDTGGAYSTTGPNIREALIAGVKTSMDFESELAKAASAEE